MVSFLGNTDFFHYSNAGGLNTIANLTTLNTLIFDAQNNDVYYAVAPGYSSLSRIMKYDLATREITTFKEADPRIGNLEPEAAWMAKIELLLVKRDYKGIFAISDLDKVTVAQFLVLSQLWLQDNNLADQAKLLEGANRLLRNYPDYGILYGVKAAILKKTDEDEFIENANKALKAEIIAPDIQIIIYSKLADFYKQRKDIKNMHASAGECLLLLDQARERYNPQEFDKTYAKMKEYMGSN